VANGRHLGNQNWPYPGNGLTDHDEI